MFVFVVKVNRAAAAAAVLAAAPPVPAGLFTAAVTGLW